MPYATFRFHYRSWDHLESLQLIPASHPRTLLPSSSSYMTLFDQVRLDSAGDDMDQAMIDDYGENETVLPEESAPWTVAVSPLCKVPTLFDQNADKADGIRQHDDYRTYLSSSASLNGDQTRLHIPVSSSSASQAYLNYWDGDRPLPELPAHKHSISHSRKSSVSSHAPSIAPSLLTWLDRDSEAGSPEPIIGLAAVVPVPRSPNAEYSFPEEHTSFSSSDSSIQAPFYLSRPSPQASSPTRTLPPPEVEDVLPASVTIRKPRHRSSATILHRHARKQEDDIESEKLNHKEACVGTTTSISPEAQWLSRQRTPSPSKKNPEIVRFPNLWSPRLDKASKSQDNHGPTDKKEVKKRLWITEDVKDIPQLGSVQSSLDDKGHDGSQNWI